MAFKLTPVLKPENSIVAGLATVGLVAAVYQLNAGPVSQVGESDSGHPSNTSAIKKAGAEALILVAGIALLARDPNIVILGGAAIIAFHAGYRHANLVNPNTGQMELQAGPSAYVPAGPGTPMQASA
jgi:hypothetical protein